MEDFNVVMDLVTKQPFHNTTTQPGQPYTLPLSFIILASISSFASILGASLIILVYYLLPQVRTTSRKLLVYLSIADLVNATGNFMGIMRYLNHYVTEKQMPCNPPETICIIQSSISTVGNLWSFFWTVCLALYLYSIIVSGNSVRADGCIPVFHLMSWTIPVCIVVLAVWQEMLGEDLTETTPGWCWISTCSEQTSSSQQILWMLLTGKLWEIAAFTASAILYVMIRWKIHKTIQHLERAMVQADTIRAITRVVRKLTFVPLIFFCLRIWGSIRFLIAAMDSEYINSGVNSTLLVLQSFGDSGQGFCNAILYCLDSRQIRQLLVRLWCPKCIHRDESLVEDSPKLSNKESTIPPTKPYREAPENSPDVIIRYGSIQELNDDRDWTEQPAENEHAPIIKQRAKRN